MKQLNVLIIGILFGIVLVKSEVISWFRIQSMFRFEEAHMYLIIGSAVIVGAISLQIVKRLQVTQISGEVIEIKTKDFNKGTIIGGALFGMGWAITGACPGPIYAQIGSGAYMAFVTFLSAIGGVYLYGLLRARLPH